MVGMRVMVMVMVRMRMRMRMRDDSAVSGGGDVVDVSLRSNSTTIDSLSRVCHTRLLACD